MDNIEKFIYQCNRLKDYFDNHPDDFQVFDFDMMHVDDRVRVMKITSPDYCKSIEIVVGFHMPGYDGLLKRYQFEIDLVHKLGNFHVNDFEEDVVVPFEMELGKIVCQRMDNEIH